MVQRRKQRVFSDARRGNHICGCDRSEIHRQSPSHQELHRGRVAHAQEQRSP